MVIRGSTQNWYPLTFKHKWSANLYQWAYKWVTVVTTPMSGLKTLLITGRGPSCRLHLQKLFKRKSRQRSKWNLFQGSLYDTRPQTSCTFSRANPSNLPYICIKFHPPPQKDRFHRMTPLFFRLSDNFGSFGHHFKRSPLIRGFDVLTTMAGANSLPHGLSSKSNTLLPISKSSPRELEGFVKWQQTTRNLEVV